MARIARSDHRLESAKRRLELKSRSKPYWYKVTTGVQVGYHKPRSGPGKWVERRYQGEQRYSQEVFATADDPPLSADGKLVLSLDQAAMRAGIVRRTLERLLAVGEGPPTIQVSKRRVGVAEGDLEAWLNSRRRVPPGFKSGKAA